MKRKVIFFTGFSLLVVLIGLPLALKQNWGQFSNGGKQRYILTDTLRKSTIFNEQDSLLLQKLIADSARILFRFPPNTCHCLEPDFAEAVKRAKNKIGENKIFVIIAAADAKDIHFFCERTKLSSPVYGTNDTLLASFDANETPYACVVFPDMTARNIVTIDSTNIDELISYAKKVIP